MLAVFCLRLACGMLACLLVLPPTLIHPRFYRTHFRTALGLACLATLFVRGTASAPLLGLLIGGVALCFLGSIVWSLEGAVGGHALIVVTTLTLASGLTGLEVAGAGDAPLTPLLLGDLTSAGVLGAALTAMLMGHSYLIAPSLSLRPLLLLLAALAVTVVARLGVDGYALWQWTAQHSLGNLARDTALWLPVRWGVGFAAPLALDGMAWQTARIRSTQSATGILYVAVIFCFLGELTGLLLRDTGVTL
jgi:hypothetical protein